MRQECGYAHEGPRKSQQRNLVRIDEEFKSKQEYKRRQENEQDDRKEVSKKSAKYDKYCARDTTILKDFYPRHHRQQNQIQMNITKQNRKGYCQRGDLQNTKRYSYPSKPRENTQQYNDFPTKKRYSKVDLLINQAKSKVYFRLPDINFLTIDVYKSMTEGEKSKVNSKWGESIEHQLVIFDKIQSQLKQKCQIAQTAASAEKKMPAGEVIWIDPPVHDWQRQLIGANNSYFQHVVGLRETYFKVVTSRHLMQQNQQ